MSHVPPMFHKHMYIHDILTSTDSPTGQEVPVSVIGQKEPCNDSEYLNVRCVPSCSSAHTLTVDTTLLDLSNVDNTSSPLLKILGELSRNDGKPILKAKIIKSVEGLDTVLYMKAIRAREEYLKSRSDTQ